MQILIHVNRTLSSVFIVVNLLIKVVFILGEYMMQSSKEAFWTFINNAMRAWCCGTCNHCGFVNRGANYTS